MQQTATYNNVIDEEGNPAGGTVFGPHLIISWQNGVMPTKADGTPVPNGVFMETLIQSVIQRLEFFQNEMEGKFSSPEGASAIASLNDAITELELRATNRAARNVDNTHEA
jgi:hypothetical protein